MAKGKGMNTAIVVAIIGLVGTLLAALLSSPWLGDKLSPTEPVPTTAVPTTVTVPTLPANATLIFQEDFEDQAASGIAFGAGTWEIVKDKANYVLQVTANTPSQDILADVVFGPVDFASGIIEFKLKFIEPGKVYLNFREQDGPGYALLIDQAGGQIALGYKSPGANGVIEFATIQSQRQTFQIGTSYLIHLEVRADQMVVYVDNGRVFSATDARLLLGRLTFTASNGTVASFDDIQVWSFGP